MIPPAPCDAALAIDVSLVTPLARSVMRRDFTRVARGLRRLQACRHARGIDPAGLHAAWQAIGQKLQRERQSAERAAARLRILLQQHSPAPSAVPAFVAAAPVQARIHSPHARHYITLLQQADQALALLAHAWLLGLVDDASHARERARIRRDLHGVHEFIRQRRLEVARPLRARQAAAPPRLAPAPAAAAAPCQITHLYLNSCI